MYNDLTYRFLFEGYERTLISTVNVPANGVCVFAPVGVDPNVYADKIFPPKKLDDTDPIMYTAKDQDPEDIKVCFSNLINDLKALSSLLTQSD
jgi:hypothetical protein